MRWLDEVLIAVEEIWLDAGFCEKISAADLSESLYLFYRTKLGLVIAAAEDRIGVAALPEWTPAEFHLPAATQTGYIERLSFAAEGTPAEYSRTWFDSDRARYVSRIGRG